MKKSHRIGGVRGDEESRTPVRRTVSGTFSERIPWVNFPVPTVRGKTVGQVASSIRTSPQSLSEVRSLRQ